MADFRRFLLDDGSPSWAVTTAQFCRKIMSNLSARRTWSCRVPRLMANLLQPLRPERN